VTLVLGLISDEGLVLASDSQVSQGITKSTGRKLWAVPGAGFAFGLSGPASTIELLSDALTSGELTASDLPSLRRIITAIVHPVLREEYERVRSMVASESEVLRVAGAGTLIAAYVGTRPYLLEADPYGSVTTTARERGSFVAIGSERLLAEYAATAYSRMRSGSLSLHQAKMLAFRILQDAIETSGPRASLSRPVQMVTVSRTTEGPSALQLADDEPETREAVVNWVEMEASRFKEHAPPPEWELGPDWRPSP